MINNPIKFGVGWRDVRLGTPIVELYEKLGPGDQPIENEPDICVWLCDGQESFFSRQYYLDGFEVAYNQQIVGIRFYYGHERSGFSNFDNFITEKGIDHSASVGKINTVYGVPLRIVNKTVGGCYLQFILYQNGDFWFINNRLVSIGVYFPTFRISDNQLEQLQNLYDRN